MNSTCKYSNSFFSFVSLVRCCCWCCCFFRAFSIAVDQSLHGCVAGFSSKRPRSGAFSAICVPVSLVGGDMNFAPFFFIRQKYVYSVRLLRLFFFSSFLRFFPLSARLTTAILVQCNGPTTHWTLENICVNRETTRWRFVQPTHSRVLLIASTSHIEQRALI